ncbi:MAG: hypothetical protein HN948_09295 [Clostridia bacterium]|jgi:uncharacterized protein|nr:hypothetical protein [Clostridia bacterium]MBT7123187.1 hypothetical protein [Clostridia bacterium]
MEKDFETVLLFDIYANLLTDKQQRLCDMYYNQDYSLAEIADIEHTSRQAVRDGIGKAKQKLNHFEQCLCISDKKSATIEAIEKDDMQAIARIWEK